jgi:hypothetical protein
MKEFLRSQNILTASVESNRGSFDEVEKQGGCFGP